MRKKALLVIYIVVCLVFVVCSTLKKQDADAGQGASTMQTLSASEKNKLYQLLQSRGKGYQLGTNCDLQGDIMVHLFFVNDAESQWDPDAITQITNKQILLGLDFLEKEAARYGIPLHFSVESHTVGAKTGTPILYEGKISKSEPHTVDIPSEIAGQFGYESGGVMYAELHEQNDCQETVWLFLVNKDGVSYARKQYEGDYYRPTLEFDVIFERYLNEAYDMDDNTHCAAAVAHEILHLYGAIDMYTPADVEKLLKPIYPKDIMLMDYIDIGKLEVGDYTAYSVGWINQAPTVP